MAQVKHPHYVESLFIEIERSRSKNIIVGIMYRPPGQDMNEFNEFIDRLLTNITQNDKLVYLIGDFNINLLNEDIRGQTSDFINILTSYLLYPSITKPTRITSKSATLIDNIFTNSKVHQTSGVIMTDISDHLPVFITTDLKIYRTNTEEEIEFRQHTEQNVKCFKSSLSNVDWEAVCSSEDESGAYTKFIHKFNELYDKCIPIKRKRGEKGFGPIEINQTPRGYHIVY